MQIGTGIGLNTKQRVQLGQLITVTDAFEKEPGQKC